MLPKTIDLGKAVPFAALEVIEQDPLQNGPLKSPTYCSSIHSEIYNTN